MTHPIRIPRVGWRRAAAVLTLVALTATACSDEPADIGVEVGDGAEEPVASVEELRVAFPSDEGPLNIFAQHEEALTELVYDKLLAPSPYVDEPQPWLASRVEQVDPSTWEVELRGDVTWHDGEPFTAADVAFTVELFKRSPAGRWTHHVTDTPHVEEVEVLSDTELVFRCAYACPFLGTVTLADLPILPEHVWQDVEEPRSVTDLPVGTGPYRLTAYDAQSGYEFEANPDYFAGAPVVQRLLLPIVEEPATAFTALRTGEVDAVVAPVPPELVEEFSGDGSVALVETTPLAYPELRLNFERPPFDQAPVRAALDVAIDRQELLEVVWLGRGRAAVGGYMHPDGAWSAPGVATTHDPARAQRQLEEAGLVDSDGDGVREHPDGTPVAFSIKVAGTQPTWVRAAELLAEQFGAVGLDVTVEQLDGGTIGSLFRSREFDAYVNGAPTHGVADPTQFVMSQESGYLWDLPEVPYPEMASLVEQWRTTETVEDRTDVLFEMQRQFAAAPTALPLHYPDGLQAYRPEAFDGWVDSPGYGIVHKWSLLPPDVARAAHAVAPGGP